MTTYTIDTLEAVRELKQAGFEPGQAEAVTKLIAHQGESLATKADLWGVEKSLRDVEKSLRHEMASMRWMLGIQSAVTLAVALRVFKIL